MNHLMREVAVHTFLQGFTADHPRAFRYKGMDFPLCSMIPDELVEPLAYELTDFIAEVLQAWLGAGSERDVTLEELTTPIMAHVQGWSRTGSEE